MNAPSIESIARTFGCTPEAVKAQFANNAKGTKRNLDRAIRTGKKVRGYTAAELSETLAYQLRRAAE